MNVFLDRFGYAIHRPPYFGKTFTSIVTQVMGVGDKIVEYLNYTALTLGFNIVKGTTLTGFDPKTEKQQKKIDRELIKLSQRLNVQLEKPGYRKPTLYQIIAFRKSRTIVQKIDSEKIDYKYYAENGWLRSDYYYPVNMVVVKRTIGNLADQMASIVQKLFT